MKTALVTGGAGFIGSHMVDHLIKEYSVHIIDNLATGEERFINKNATFHKQDVRNANAIKTLVTHIKPDVIFHIAGQASNINSFTDPHFDIDVNFKGTVNMVLAALAAKTPRFLYASSMTTYGHPDHIPVSETQSCRPVSYYGISKYAAERFVHATGERTDLTHPFHVTSFRMFNVYGPRQSLTNSYQGALAIFIGNVLRNEPIRIFGDGEQSRDFVYIDDVVDTWTTAIDNTRSYNQVFNIGNGKKISVNDTVRAIIEAAEKDPQTYDIRYENGRPGEQRHMEADMKKAADILDFRVSVPFVDGLRRTIDWAKSQ